MVWERAMVGGEIGFGVVQDKMVGMADLPAFIVPTLKGMSFIISTPFSNPVPISLNVPFPLQLHPSTAQVQEESFRWASETFKLFPDSYKPALERGVFGWLSGCCYPNVSTEMLQIITDYLAALFCIDDKLDSTDSNGGATPESIKKKNDRKINIMSGADIPDKSDKELFKALRNIYERLQPCLKEEVTLDYFSESLSNYLRSTEVEAKDRAAKKTPTEDTHTVLRRYTGGAINAFAIGFLALGININALFREFFWLRDAIYLIADCVGLSNDDISLQKELKEILKQLGLEKKTTFTPEEQEAIKRNVFNNLALIKWKNGKEMDQAIHEVEELHNTKMQEFINLLKTHEEAIVSNPALKEAIVILISWANGNPAWSRINGRYNINFTKPDAEAFFKILK
jgi:hypothetical protein